MEALTTTESPPEGRPSGSTPERIADAAQLIPSRSRWGVLRHKHFRVFWTAAFGSFLGNWFEFVGTQWIVGKTTGSTEWLAYIAMGQLFPTLFLGLLGGIVADRVNRKKLLIVTQMGMMLVALGLFAVVALGVARPWVLLVLAIAQGVCVAFNNPAWQVMIPRLVPREDLVKAITIQGISFNAARAIGPAIAGVLMGLFGPSLLFLVNALSYIGVLVAVFTTPDAPAPVTDGGKLLDFRTIWRDTAGAMRFTFGNRGPRAAMLAVVFFALLATPVLRFLPLFVTNVYHMEEATFGVLTGIMGVGAVAGGLLMRFVPPWYPKHHFIPFSVLMGGAWILLFSLTTDVRVAAFYMFFVGLYWMWSFNTSMAALQMLVDDAVRGRVMAVCNTVSLGFMPLGAFVASLVGESASGAVRARWNWLWDDGLATQIGIAFVSLVLIGAGVCMMIWRTPEVDGLRPGDPGYDRRPGFLRGIFATSHRARATPRPPARPA